MTKRAISVTLDAENLQWLKGRAHAVGRRSVSELLDQLVREARHAGIGPARSVVGTIDIAADDPGLERADEAVRALFARSLGRPSVVKEESPRYGRRERPVRPAESKPARRRRG